MDVRFKALALQATTPELHRAKWLAERDHMTHVFAEEWRFHEGYQWERAERSKLRRRFAEEMAILGKSR